MSAVDMAMWCTAFGDVITLHPCVASLWGMNSKARCWWLFGRFSLSPESAAINTANFQVLPWRECLLGIRKRGMPPTILCAVDAICY